MECNNDLNSMIDVAKVADLVLLMIDASFGFEMVRTCFVVKKKSDSCYSIGNI